MERSILVPRTADNTVETISYGLLIGVIALGLVFYLCHSNPVNYTIFLISEDLMGRIFHVDKLCAIERAVNRIIIKAGSAFSKIMWAMMGLAAFFIGAEEVSWGQRIFNFSTPFIGSEVNLQGEFNFHNLKYVNEIDYHDFAAYVILAWSFFSVAVSFWFTRLKNIIHNFGLPLIPNRLVLVFLTIPYLFVFYPVVKSDEIGEFFLSVAVVIWTSDLFMKYFFIKRIRGLRAVISVCGILFLVAVLSAGMTYRFPGDLDWRLNIAASRDYPSFGMYDQAESIYGYIYSHPKYLEPETRINHARMLLGLNNKNKAFNILSVAVEEFETKYPSQKQLSRNLRSFGTVLTLLEQYDRAADKFKQAIKVDEQQIQSTLDENIKVKLLWSIAKTLAARGDISAAVDKAQQASSESNSSKMHQQINEWIKDLKESTK